MKENTPSISKQRNMILSSIRTLLRITLSYLELFLLNNLSRLFSPKSVSGENFIATNEKYRYDLRKTQSKHLKMLLISKIIRICVGESSLKSVAKSFFGFSKFASTLVLCC